MTTEETYGDAIPQEILADEEGTEEAAEVIEEEPEGPGIRGFAERILRRIPMVAIRSPGKAGNGEGSESVKKRPVKLQTLTYDDEAEEYTLTQTPTYFEDLPPEAVHITGKKNRYFLDLVEDPDYSDPQGIRATDLYLWMVNNDINDALAVRSKGLGDVDIRRYLVIGVGAIIGVCVLYAMF